MDQLAEQIPDQLIEDAKQALIKDDKNQTEKLFEQVTEQASSSQRCAITCIKIQWRKKYCGTNT